MEWLLKQKEGRKTEWLRFMDDQCEKSSAVDEEYEKEINMVSGTSHGIHRASCEIKKLHIHMKIANSLYTVHYNNTRQDNRRKLFFFSIIYLQSDYNSLLLILGKKILQRFGE